MGTIAHTKGPWTTGVDGIRIAVDWRDDHGNLSAAASHNGWIKTVCRINHAIYIKSEADANARLIAVAPDMYQICRDMASLEGIISKEYLDRISVVLAKARGEQQ